jgi:diguanylate cyclase (GGDEF)-like protein
VILDLRTIFISGAVTCYIIGTTLLLAFATGRFTRWPAWWGISSLCIGTGLLCGALRDRIPDIISIEFGNTINIAGALLLLFGVRSFAGKSSSWGLFAAVLAATWMALAAMPGEDGFVGRVVVTSVVLACCDGAIVREGALLARRERLRSGWILAGFFAPTVLIYAVRAISVVADGSQKTLFPPEAPVQSWAAACGIGFVVLRGNALFLLVAERSNDTLATLARRDPLTGLLNRSGLQDALAAMARSDAPGARRASLFVADVDHFKTVNDGAGHAAGDEVLLLFAEVARKVLRAHDIVARQGGDEFVVVLPGLGASEAMAVAERLRKAFRDATASRAQWPVQPTLSIGLTEAEIGSRSVTELLEEADAALYRAKKLGRDRVQAQLSPARA